MPLVLLQAALIILKLTGTVAWSWGWILSPVIAATVFQVLFMIGVLGFLGFVAKQTRGPWDR